MSAWEDVGATYAEAATKALPLHRAVVFAAGFLVSLAIQRQTHLSILETLSCVPLTDFATFEKGFLAKATSANAMWAIGLTIVAVLLSKTLTRLAYMLVDRATGASKRAAQLDRAWLKGLSIEERKAALELIDAGLAEPRGRLRSMTSINELLSGIGIAFAVAAHWGNVLDGTISGVALVSAACSHLLAIQIFLGDYFGPALTRAQLQGKRVPHIATVI